MESGRSINVQRERWWYPLPDGSRFRTLAACRRKVSGGNVIVVRALGEEGVFGSCEEKSDLWGGEGGKKRNQMKVLRGGRGKDLDECGVVEEGWEWEWVVESRSRWCRRRVPFWRG